MSKIYLLDDISTEVTNDRDIRFKKIYQFDMTYILPLDLELIIKEYINEDIIIQQELVDYDSESNTYRFFMNGVSILELIFNSINDNLEYVILRSSNIITLSRDDDIYDVWTHMINKYVKTRYNKNNYLIFHNEPIYYFQIYYYFDNRLCCFDDRHNTSSYILIHNHKLFKQMIVIIKLIINNIRKN